MILSEFIDKLLQYDPAMEVQAIVATEPYLKQSTATDEPIIEVMKGPKKGDYLVIRA